MKSDDPNKVVTQWPKTANFVKTVSGWDIYFDTGVAQEPNGLRATVGVVSKMEALRVLREWPKLFNGNNACFANVTVDVINKAVNVTLNVDGEYALRFDVPGPEPVADATEQNRMTAVFGWEGNLTSGVKSVPMVSHFAVLEDDRTVDAAMFVNKVVQFTANEDLEKLLQGFRDLAVSINTGKPSGNAKTFEPINELLLSGFKPDQMQVIGAYKSTFESMIKNVYREGHTLIDDRELTPEARALELGCQILESKMHYDHGRPIDAPAAVEGADAPADPPIRVNPMYLMTHEKREPLVNTPEQDAFEKNVQLTIHEFDNRAAEMVSYPRGRSPHFVYLDDLPWVNRWITDNGVDVKRDSDDVQKKETDKPDSDK